MLVDVGGTLCSPLHAHLHQLDDVTWAVGGARGAKRRRVIKGCADFTEYWSRIKELFIIYILMYCTDLKERVVTSYSPSGPRETLCHSSPCMCNRETHTKDMQVHRLSKFDSFHYIHQHNNVCTNMLDIIYQRHIHTYILIHHSHTYINVHLNFGAAHTIYTIHTFSYVHNMDTHTHTHTHTHPNTHTHTHTCW